MAKIAFFSYRREMDKKINFENSYVISVQSLEAGENWSQIGWNMAKIAVLSYRRETEKKVLYCKQLCDQFQKLGGCWKFELNWLKNGQNGIFEL